MTGSVIVLVVAGVGAALLLGIGAGFDTGALLLFAAIVAFGVLAIAVARKSRAGVVGPARCPDCDGLLSPNAPYCKHCGRALGRA